MYWLDDFEEYFNESAIESAIKATIDTCIEHGDTKEETFEYASKKFPKVSKQHISECISEFWDKK